MVGMQVLPTLGSNNCVYADLVRQYSKMLNSLAPPPQLVQCTMKVQTGAGDFAWK